MLVWKLLCSVLFLPATVLAGFGWHDDGENYVVDNGANLVIKVSKCCGDIVSMLYKGDEYQGYSYKNTQVESGLGESTVTLEQFTSPVYIVKITIKHGPITNTLITRYKNDNVYILTKKDNASFRVQRYIVRFPSGIFPHSDQDTDYYPADCESIETHDICQRPSDGHTFSKHYQGLLYGRTIDYDYVGKTTGSVGMWMVRSNHEKASGGPFYRSLLRRGSPDGEDLYDIYYYGESNTDVQRWGLQGPSVLAFTSGGTPDDGLFARKADWGWMDDLKIEGWVPASGRGYAAGVGIANMKSGYEYVVGLANDEAQYWAKASSSNGAWSIHGILPGTYTVTVYKDELEVQTSSVTVRAGSGSAVHTLTCDDPSDDASLWRIGEWDGTPAGFLNFEEKPFKPTYMHPSDSRLKDWNPSNFIVGTTATNQFPGYIWQDINNNHIIYFKLNKDQLTSGHTVRIGMTQGYIGGRPAIHVNEWDSDLPSATHQASTRSLTVGTYRGNNVMLTFDVPQSAWVQSTSEWQRLVINVITGSTGSGFLSGGVSFDCLDLI